MIQALLITHTHPTLEKPWVTPFIHSFSEALAEEETLRIHLLVPETAGTLPKGKMKFHTFFVGSSNRIPHKGIGKSHQKINLFEQVRFLWSGTRAALKVAKEEQIDIIHAHWALPSGLIAFLVSKLCSIPYVVTTHGRDVINAPEYGYAVPTSPLLRILLRTVLKHASTVVTTSTITARATDNIYHQARTVHIPVGIDSSWLAPRDKEYQKQTRIVCIGDLVPIKGQILLLEAIADSKELKGIPVLFIGEGADRLRLEIFCQQKNLANVILTGAKPPLEVRSLLEESSILAFPSQVEAFGLVILEALACGCRVVGANTGAIELLKDEPELGEIIIPFTTGDIQELKKSLEIAILKAPPGNDLLEGARSTLKKKYSWNVIAQQYYHTYKITVGEDSTRN